MAEADSWIKEYKTSFVCWSKSQPWQNGPYGKGKMNGPWEQHQESTSYIPQNKQTNNYKPETILHFQNVEIWFTIFLNQTNLKTVSVTESQCYPRPRSSISWKKQTSWTVHLFISFALNVSSVLSTVVWRPQSLVGHLCYLVLLYLNTYSFINFCFLISLECRKLCQWTTRPT